MAKAQKKEIPFSGKLMTNDPAVIGMNFQTLTNMRYTDTNIKSVAGMTKINTSAMNATYLKTRNAFQFRKAQPSENHVIVQAYNAALGASQLLENTTAVPSQGAFSATALWSDTAGAGTGRFCEAPDGQMIYANSVDACIWGGNENKVGAAIQITTALSALADVPDSPKDYTEAINNTKTATGEYFTCGGSFKTFLIGSSRPAKGAKIYILTANTSANTLVVKESTHGEWNQLTITADGTRTGGTTSFAQTGTISWASTVTTTKPRYLEGYYLYWYQFTVDVGTALIYHITLDLPFQGIVDSWDGVFRPAVKLFQKTAGGVNDYTTQVLEEDYDSTAAETFYNISSLAAFSDPNNCLEIGFSEKMTALQIVIPVLNSNSTAGTTMSIDYWDGTGYATVGAIVDGTAVGGISLARSGVVSWQNSAITDEVMKSISNSIPLYYYRVKFDENIDASTHVDYIGGIIAMKTLSYYKFPVFAQGRVLLCGDMSGEKNMALCSSKFMPQVYNGDDSVKIYFGDEGELTCGMELFSQYGSSLYSLVLMFKDYETWVMAGQDINAWENSTFLLSSSIGCPAPLTLKTINLRAEPGAGVNRALAIWQGANGIYMSDGRAPIPIHGDIEEYFDATKSTCIKASKVGDSVGFVDDANQEYHWLFASGTDTTTLNKELVYDIKRNRWFEIDRSADLQCGVSVHDTDGNAYAYGFLDTGYMERLESGTDFDGTAITATVQLGDMPLGGWDVETGISDVTLFTKAQTNDITCTHYGDTSSSGTAHTMDHTSTNRLAMPEFDDKLNGYFHSLKYSTTVTFEPFATVIWFHEL